MNSFYINLLIKPDERNHGNQYNDYTNSYFNQDYQKKLYYDSKLTGISHQIQYYQSNFEDNISKINYNLDEISIKLEEIRSKTVSLNRIKDKAIISFENSVNEKFDIIKESKLQFFSDIKQKVDSKFNSLIIEIKKNSQERKSAIETISSYVENEVPGLRFSVNKIIEVRKENDVEIKNLVKEKAEKLIPDIKKLSVERIDVMDNNALEAQRSVVRVKSLIEQEKRKREEFDEYMTNVLERTLNSISD